jgi:hypothetical protein
VGFLALVASLGVQAEGRVEVVIRETTRPAGSPPVLVDITFINKGDAPFFIHRPATPFGTRGDELNGDHFLVTDSSGELLPYIGVGAGYWGRVRLNHFIAVAPGESAHKEVNLNTGYDLTKGGDFKIRFHASLDTAEPEAEVSSPEELRTFVRNSQKFVQSNEITIHVDPGLARGSAASRNLPGAGDR